MNEQEKSIVLFDGVCNFCNGSVNYIIEHDSKDYFRFAPLQTEIAEKLLAQHNIDQEQTDSVILVENGRAYTYSTAALKISRHLKGLRSWIYGFIIVPKFIRDYFYKLFAKNRYRLFGKQEQCMIPTPEIRRKFL